MASFNLKKGDKFAINKGIQRVRIGLGWQASPKAGEAFDPDASCFGLIYVNGKPKFYNDASHALTYANTDLKKNPKDKSFQTADGTMIHTGDNRVGGDGNEDCEQMIIGLSKLPEDIKELSIFISIYEAQQRKQDFSRITGAYVRVIDEDARSELCRYNLQNEYADQTAVQVGSFMRADDGNWNFKAVGAGSKVDLGAILAAYS